MAKDDVFEAYTGLLTRELVEWVHVELSGALRACREDFEPEQLAELLGVSAATVAVWAEEQGARERTMTLVNGTRLSLFVLVYRRGVPRILLRTRRDAVVGLYAGCLEVGSVVTARSLLGWTRARLGVLNAARVTRLSGGAPHSGVVRRLRKSELEEVSLRAALTVLLGVAFATLAPEGSPLTLLARELSERHGFRLPGVEVMGAAFDAVRRGR
jgi:hypothetical protein